MHIIIILHDYYKILKTIEKIFWQVVLFIYFLKIFFRTHQRFSVGRIRPTYLIALDRGITACVAVNSKRFTVRQGR